MLLKMKSCFYALFLLFFSAVTLANTNDPFSNITGNDKFLPVEQAFQFDFSQQGEHVTLSWQIADDYYLYADKFQFAIDNGEYEIIDKPGATEIEDEFFGVVNVYFFEAKIKLLLNNLTSDAELKVRFQGCAMAGLCYNPVTVAVPVSNPSSTTVSEPANTAQSSEQYQLTDSLKNESLIMTLLVFFALGVGLALTPCVFPMFPILAGIIAGQDSLTTKRGLWLAFIYVQGMAITYSLLGLVVASMGSQFQAYLQHPSILIATSILFIVLAGSMFGWFNLQLPHSWTAKLTNMSNQQKSGNIVGVFLMGVLSGLIASPCTTAPLTGALLYVAQTGDLAIGFLTLYVLSLGMGLPLLLIGASGGKLLPKAGEWMNKVKVLFGFVLLVVPIILLERIISADYFWALSGIWLLAVATYLYTVEISLQNKVRPFIWLLKMLLFVGAMTAFLNAFPVIQFSSSQTSVAAKHEGFKQIETLDDLRQEIVMANNANRPVMIDLYADWCVACKEFKKYTFPDPTVQQYMSQFHMLQIDMTEVDKNDLAFMKEYDVLGLPTILFFSAKGTELTQQRVTGFQKAEQFANHLQNILTTTAAK